MQGLFKELDVRTTTDDRRAADAEKMSMNGVMLPRTLGLFAITAVAELLGCYLPLLWLTGKGSAWLLGPAAVSLAIFVWLLTLHPSASGRVYATYGAVYIAMSLIWLHVVDGVTPTWNDYVGAALALLGAGVITLGHKSI